MWGCQIWMRLSEQNQEYRTTGVYMCTCKCGMHTTIYPERPQKGRNKIQTNDGLSLAVSWGPDHKLRIVN